MSDSLDPSAPYANPRTLHYPNLSSILRPRAEAFEYGLLPIPKLVFNDPIQTLAPMKQKLSVQFPTNRVDLASLAEALHISIDHANLVLDTLSSVLHRDPNDSVGADVRDLILFLYIQSYKKLLPRPHKDPAAVADVWPSTSAFAGYLSALSPLQLVRSNSHRFMPSQADEEAHQLSYLQKHLGNMIYLLAEPSEGEGEESRNMPAVPVPVAQVHDWLQQNITSAQEHISERVSSKQNGPSYSSDQDVAMSDAPMTSAKSAINSKGPCFIEGISKSSLVKQATDLNGSSVKVLNCHDSVIYILAPL